MRQRKRPRTVWGGTHAIASPGVSLISVTIRPEAEAFMSNHLKFYINGAWVDPATPRALDVINPATEEPFTRISIGSATDVDRAVAAARAALAAFSQTSKADRIVLLKRIIECYRARMNDIAQAVSAEMGAPIRMALDSQAAAGLAHL